MCEGAPQHFVSQWLLQLAIQCLHEMLHFMLDHKLENAPVTTSDGRLVGLLLQKDVVAAMEKEK